MGPNWLDLPIDVTAFILQKLSVADILTSARQVCSLWWNICKDPLMMRSIDLTLCRNYPAYMLRAFCRYAVDQSCGHLEDITIEYFATDDFLKYIASSSSHLRRLRLPYCSEISEKGLIEVAKKLPHLEELVDISYSPLTKDSLQAIGRCCPHLKVLKFYNGPLYPSFKDEEAFAIAQTMPELRHLHIVGFNFLSKDGLHAILDGCPLLESLHILHSYNIDWRTNETLRKRCLEHIKEVQLPRKAYEIKY
ncbi:F-box protein SKIP19-like [Lotus japonicus]|uniref:F-box protein SKIP19-like n=1 Tax=Lotus japonicus TaxID=34305 RepID=UPI00258ADF59|nr:F-box protein SKIP19-like [Lotus japonicus]